MYQHHLTESVHFYMGAYGDGGAVAALCLVIDYIVFL